MIQRCQQCNGKGYVRVNLGGVFIDATCFDCNATGYINASEDSGNVPDSCEKNDDSADTGSK